MAASPESLVIAIQDGAFPDSEKVLSMPIDSKSIPTLLRDIGQARLVLQDEIREISRSEAEDVDSWIAQAKKVQDDIERCKAEARHIVEEHERLEAIRKERDEARSRTHLLEEEIVYNKTLEQQVKLIGHISMILNETQSFIRNGQLDHAARNLQPIPDNIEAIRGSEVRSLLRNSYENLVKATKQGLLNSAHQAIEVRKETNSISIMIKSPVAVSESFEETSAQGTAATLNLETILSSLEVINCLEELMRDTVVKINTTLQPHLHTRSLHKISGAETLDGRLKLSLTAQHVDAVHQVHAIRVLTSYLQQHLPASIRKSVLSRVLEVVIPKMIANILDPAIPLRLEDLSQVGTLQSEVRDLADSLKAGEMPQHEALSQWCERISQKWLTRKRVSSLDQIRQVLRKASPTISRVQRVEQQTIDQCYAPPTTTVSKEEEDWSAWDNDDDGDSVGGKEQIATPNTSQTKVEDEPDAWGFGDDDDTSLEKDRGRATGVKPKAEENDADAWGWDDEDTSPVESKSTSPVTLRAHGPPVHSQTNRAVVHATVDAVEDQTQVAELREHYTITSIPDDILSILHEHSSGIEKVMSSPSTYFSRSTPESSIDLQNSLIEGPSQILALYRALAPSRYLSSNLRLTHMHLYNDTLYLVSRLSSSDPKVPSTDLQKLTIFATQTYTTEIAQQRQILLDLLDTAQSFSSCTREPYASSCETAIDSTTNYLRSLHAQWQPILGQSHLYQALGSLLSSVISKLILDILDMEDISDPESKKLNAFCERIASLSALFASVPTSSSTPRAQAHHHDNDNDNDDDNNNNNNNNAVSSTSSIALFVPNYIRFQYLMQVLTGNLKDIEYLWTEAGLGLEFSRDEVIDLIKALFSESARRREVIGHIRR